MCLDFCRYLQNFQTSEQRLPTLEYLRTYAENIRAAITILRILAQNPLVEYLHTCAKIIHFSSRHLRKGAQSPCSDYVICHRRIFCVVRRYSSEYSVAKIYAKTPPQDPAQKLQIWINKYLLTFTNLMQILLSPASFLHNPSNSFPSKP